MSLIKIGGTVFNMDAVKSEPDFVKRFSEMAHIFPGLSKEEKIKELEIVLLECSPKQSPKKKSANKLEDEKEGGE